jgi:CubicO group peptidase (beta-lactamase class C family)
VLRSPATDVVRCDLSTAFVKATDPPGTQFTYSPTGPTVAARVVELLTGQPFETAFQERIGKPLGMRETSFTRTADGDESRGGPDPAAGAVSSAAEYLRFVEMLDDGGSYRGDAVLSPDSARAMLRLETADARFKDDPTAADLDSVGYGLGAWVEAADKDGSARLIDSFNPIREDFLGQR